MHFSPVVPRSLERAKRVAKKLHRFYPRHPLSKCQGTTARLYGHKDWHALEQAIANKMASAALDDELSAAELRDRFKHQYRIICIELTEVDPDADYPAPDQPRPNPTLTHAELAVHALALRALVPTRVEQASKRFEQIFALEALREISPTSRAQFAPSSITTVDELSILTADHLNGLPLLLGRWWNANLPYQPDVGRTLSDYDLDSSSRASLLKFGQYWGTLCVHYAEVINWAMGMGVSYLLAERYGWDCTVCHPIFDEYVSALESGATDAELAPTWHEVNNILHQNSSRYYKGFPRDDFWDSYRAQPVAFMKNAQSVIHILAEPGSRRGTWDDDIDE